MTRSTICQRRNAMTLIELLISLALTAVIASLIGGLMQWYTSNQTKADNTFRQLRLGRTLLAMIADDVRCVVRNEPFDVAPLTSLIQSSMGGAATGGGGQAGDASSALSTSAMSTDSFSSAPTSGTGAAATDGGETSTTSSIPPGIYGSETAIEIDVSQPPRPDQYVVMMPDIMSGTLTDLPTDIKTVSYYIQGQQVNGVRDPLAQFTGDLAGGNTLLSGSGLVRRSIARVVLQQAYDSGSPEQVSRTGELIAPEAIGLGFQYYDGVEWFPTWDAATQGIPFAIRISLALQSQNVPMEQRLIPPLNLQTTSPTTLAQSGVTVFTTLVTVPGAALATQPAGATDDGSSALGL